MKIATWNVNSGSIPDRWVELTTEYDVDVVAMQESAKPVADSTACFWQGELKHKGVSIASKLPCHLMNTIQGECSPSVAIKVKDSEFGPFNVLGVWAKPTPSYFADLTRTFDLYDRFIRERPTVILGDFNMTVRVKNKGRRFYSLNARLNHDFDVHSAYHEFSDERFGMETMTTLYHQWGSGGCFHCDFIYLPSAWLSKLQSVEVAGYTKFSTSDHRPVVCQLS